MNALSIITCLLLQLNPPQEVLTFFTEEKFKKHIAVLSHDSLEGRAPSTPGDKKAIQYIVSQMKAFGLEPAGEKKTYIQKVPVVGVTVDNTATVTISNGKEVVSLAYSTDFVATTGTHEPEIVLKDADIVFVGFGIVAPEQQWDDYKDVDVSGKILLMMNNDPAGDDPTFFAGKGRTYYGRWTYKYEIAAKKGAIGAIVIHTTPSAGYQYHVIQNSWSREMFDLEDNGNAPKLKLKSWTTEDATRKFLQLNGYHLDSLMALAQSASFRPVNLGLQLSTSHAFGVMARQGAQMRSVVRRLETNNIVGKITGSDPVLKNQYIIFTAHYDHFGIGRPVNGDSIYNGALDNASGTSMMLNLAQAFASSTQKPARSLLFAAVAAEEQGLLGSSFYANNPTVPIGNIVANINTDVINVVGRTTDITFQGSDRSSLGNDLNLIAKEMNLMVKPDPAPEQGSFYRSDHFSFAKVGVPAMSMGGGRDVVGVDSAVVSRIREDHTKNYHQPGDEMKEYWNYDGALQQAELVIRLAWRIANIIEMPSWNPGDEFEAVRKASLRK